MVYEPYETVEVEDSPLRFWVILRTWIR